MPMVGARSTACAVVVAVSSASMLKLVASGTVASQRANQQRPSEGSASTRMPSGPVLTASRSSRFVFLTTIFSVTVVTSIVSVAVRTALLATATQGTNV